MNTALTLEVPLKVDLSAGDNWLDVEAIERMRLLQDSAGPEANLQVRRFRGPANGFSTQTSENPLQMDEA